MKQPLVETVAIRRWHIMSISSRRSAAGCFVRWIRIPPPMPPGAEVRNITTLKIQEREYEEISTFQSFHAAPFHLPPRVCHRRVMATSESLSSAIFMLPPLWLRLFLQRWVKYELIPLQIFFKRQCFVWLSSLQKKKKKKASGNKCFTSSAF